MSYYDSVHHRFIRIYRLQSCQAYLTTELGTKVSGVDNTNDWYDVRIKEVRLTNLQKFEDYTFIKGNLADKALINSIFEQYHPEIVVNLGAQTGVRYFITNSDAYIDSNMICCPKQIFDSGGVH